MSNNVIETCMRRVPRTARLFFSEATMKVFESRIETKMLDGRYFITSEAPGRLERAYTIRELTGDDIKTVGEFRGHETRQDALKALVKIQEGNR
jgi:hypothetical protein